MHGPNADPQTLLARLEAARGLARSDSGPLLGQLRSPLLIDWQAGTRVVSIWQPAQPLRADGARQVPWAQLGAVLAGVHRILPPRDLPPHGGRARLVRAARGLVDVGAPAWLVELAHDLHAIRPPVADPACLVHGDLHLGQFAQVDGRWRLLDLDDLGVGDPAVDLGRIAGSWAAGLLEDEAWEGFLSGYREADGPAVPASGDPWLRLDLPARISLVIAVYGMLRDRAAGVQVDADLVDALMTTCLRMTTHPVPS
ncbi:MAG: phosphotransferase family protein [Actinomycetales bacterium]